MGFSELASEHLSHAVASVQAANDLGIQARIHRTISVMYEYDGDNQLAMAHATWALELFREDDDPTWVADTLNTVGWCAALPGRHNEALECLRRALARYRDLGDIYHVPDTLDRDSVHAIERLGEPDRFPPARMGLSAGAGSVSGFGITGSMGAACLVQPLA